MVRRHAPWLRHPVPGLSELMQLLDVRHVLALSEIVPCQNDVAVNDNRASHKQTRRCNSSPTNDPIWGPIAMSTLVFLEAVMKSIDAVDESSIASATDISWPAPKERKKQSPVVGIGTSYAGPMFDTTSLNGWTVRHVSTYDASKHAAPECQLTHHPKTSAAQRACALSEQDLPGRTRPSQYLPPRLRMACCPRGSRSSGRWDPDICTHRVSTHTDRPCGAICAATRDLGALGASCSPEN